MQLCQSSISIFLVLLVATCAVSSVSAGQRRFDRNRKFARQEVAPPAEADAVTPYPSADEIRPEVPFDEAAAANTPEVVYGPPEGNRNNVPDEIYGPPDVYVNSLTPEASEPEPSIVDAQQSARYQRQRSAAYRQAAKLRNAALKRRI